GMKELKELFAVDIVDMTLLWKLQELAPTVEIVTTNKGYMFPGVHDSTASENGFNAQLIRANPFIKSLRFVRFPFRSLNLYKPNGHPSIAEVLVVLSQLPNLEYLKLRSIKDHNAIIQESLQELGLPIIPATLSPLEQGSTLTRLDIDDTRNLIPLLRYLPNLKVLKVPSLSDEAFEVLAASCKNLEVLEWMHIGPFLNEYSSERPAHDVLHKFL
ncbi:hypothetical protein BGZ65_000647, partial [Modicella reniformis]